MWGKEGGRGFGPFRGQTVNTPCSVLHAWDLGLGVRLLIGIGIMIPERTRTRCPLLAGGLEKRDWSRWVGYARSYRIDVGLDPHDFKFSGGWLDDTRTSLTNGDLQLVH